MPERDIIVIGASAGGVEALLNTVKELPANFSATIFIVLHVPAQSPSLLPGILGRVSKLPVAHGQDGAPIQAGHIYIAPPDNHLLVEKGFIRVVRGPKENRHRPAVDPLFRSAALAYRNRVIGVILSGALDDGTAGLVAIKRYGGLAVVQDPLDALYPGMPSNAIANVRVDYILPLAQIPALLIKLVQEPDFASNQTQAVQASEDAPYLKEEVLELEEGTAHKGNERPGQPSAFSCPECGGVLWELKDDQLLRFRCRVGHAFSVGSLIAEQSDAVEAALWVALKAIEESASLAEKMALTAYQRNQVHLAEHYEKKAEHARENAHLIQNVLLQNQEKVEATSNGQLEAVIQDLPPTNAAGSAKPDTSSEKKE